MSEDPAPAESAPTTEGTPAAAAVADPPVVGSLLQTVELNRPAQALLPPIDAGVAGQVYSHIYDAAAWRNIPHGSDAMLYDDGEFAVPEDAARILALHRARYITVTGAWYRCSIIDYERLNPAFSPPRLRGFVRGRRSRSMDAIVYCNQETAAEAIAALRDSGRGHLLAYPRLFWIIATLDDIQRTSAELCATLAKDWDAPEIRLQNLWANQVTDTGLVDVSNRFLPWLS